MGMKNNKGTRDHAYVLDYLIDGKSQAEKIFRQQELRGHRIVERRGIKGYPNRRLISMTYNLKDADLLQFCIYQLYASAPKEVLEEQLTIERVVKENLLLQSKKTR